jgi:hypothetical protein
VHLAALVFPFVLCHCRSCHKHQGRQGQPTLGAEAAVKR